MTYVVICCGQPSWTAYCGDNIVVNQDLVTTRLISFNPHLYNVLSCNVFKSLSGHKIIMVKSWWSSDEKNGLLRNALANNVSAKSFQKKFHREWN